MSTTSQISPLHEKVRALVPLRFQALAMLLMRRELGEPFSDVRDTAGDGNGCDGVHVAADGAHALQARTVEHALGEGQRSKARDSVALAKERVPTEFGAPLTRFTFVWNIDLQPEEHRWFTGYSAKQMASGLSVEKRELSWITNQLLLEPNATLRREFTETEADRQLELVRLLTNPAPSASEIANLQTSLAELQRQIVTLQEQLHAATARPATQAGAFLRSARASYTLGLTQFDEAQYQRAAETLSALLADLAPLSDEHFYVDVLYWCSMAQYRANMWREALAGLTEAHERYVRVGRTQEAQYAKGNQGHIHVAMGNLAEAVTVFEQMLSTYRDQGDHRNVLSSLMNIAMAWTALHQEHMALGHLSKFREYMSALPDEDQMAVVDLVPIATGAEAQALFLLEQDEAAAKLMESAIEGARSLGDHETLAKLSAELAKHVGLLNASSDNYRRSLELFKTALATPLLEHDAHLREQTLFNRGLVHAGHGQPASALMDFKTSARLCEELGDEMGLRQTLAQIEALERKP